MTSSWQVEQNDSNCDLYESFYNFFEDKCNIPFITLTGELGQRHVLVKQCRAQIANFGIARTLDRDRIAYEIDLQ